MKNNKFAKLIRKGYKKLKLQEIKDNYLIHNKSVWGACPIGSAYCAFIGSAKKAEKRLNSSSATTIRTIATDLKLSFDLAIKVSICHKAGHSAKSIAKALRKSKNSKLQEKYL